MEAILRNYFHAGSTQILALSYAGAGLLGTAIHYCVFFVLLSTTIIDVVSASTTGALAGGLVNYWLAHSKVFRSNVHHHVALPRFAIVAALGIGINALLLSILVVPIGVLGGQLIASLAILTTGFLLNRTWSFRAQEIR